MIKGKELEFYKGTNASLSFDNSAPTVSSKFVISLPARVNNFASLFSTIARHLIPSNLGSIKTSELLILFISNFCAKATSNVGISPGRTLLIVFVEIPMAKFFFKIFIPNIKAGIGITAFFCFMFSWVELLLAKTLTAVEAKPIAATMTRTASTSGYELGLLAAAGVLTIIPGAIVIYFVRNYIAKGFSLGRV